MSDFEKQLNKAVKATKLSADEKRELKARVVSYMEYHPRREMVSQKKAAQYLESQPYTVLNFNNLFVRGIVGAFAVFMVVFVPSLAERAVPGDVLYPIKVRVNEEIRGGLTFSAADKVAWETERLSRRIAEVRLLADEGKLTAEVEAAAAEAVKAHAEAAQDGINRLRNTDADEAVLAEVAFESALDVQTAVLDAETEEGEEQGGTDVVAIASVVRAAKETAVASKGTAQPPAEKIAARIEQQTTRAYELFTSLEDKVAPEERAEIERRLQDIERAIALHTTAEIVSTDEVQPEETVEPALTAVTTDPVEATTTAAVAEENSSTTPEVAEKQTDTEAAEKIVAAIKLTPALEVNQTEALLLVLADIQKLISFMTDLDVRTSVKLDTLVPVVLTTEEREAAVLEAVEAAAKIVANSRQVMAETNTLEDGVEEKITNAIAELEPVIEVVSSNEELALEEKEALVESIASYVADIEKLIAPHVNESLEQPSEQLVETGAESEVTDEETGTTTEATIEEEEEISEEDGREEESQEEVTDENQGEEDTTETEATLEESEV